MPTILVVDDDEHIREFLRKSLSPHLTVVEAADGAQAVAAARWSRPQVVVMDLEMPVVDGYEAARQIKADPSAGNPILIAVTGALTENAVPRARAAGFSYFVHKDVDARNFVEKIVRLVKDAAGLELAKAAATVAPPAVSPKVEPFAPALAAPAAPKAARPKKPRAAAKKKKAKPARAKAPRRSAAKKKPKKR
jgi:two-component system cell cycle response regulator DivK